MYTGLVKLTVLVVFGIVGIVSTVLPRPVERAKPAATLQVRDVHLPGGLDDRRLADYLQASLNLPLTRPVPDWMLGRDRRNRLRFRLWTPARFYEVLVLEKQGKVQITTQPFDVWQYLFHLHEMTPATGHPHLPTLLWAWYIEFSIWSLMLMSLSGVYLWLASRPGYRWAQVSFAAGSVIFVVFYIVIR